MNLLDLLRKSKLKINAPNGNKPTPYQDGIIKLRNVKFPPTLSPGAVFEDYIRYEGTSVVPSSQAPVPEAISYLVTENDNFLMTENDNNLIV